MLILLTDPVSFIASIPDDPFSQKKPRYGFSFIRLYTGNVMDAADGRRTFYILVSVGPDQTPMLSTDLGNRGDEIIKSVKNGKPGSWGIPYDPTNGSVSAGGVFSGTAEKFSVARNQDSAL